MRFVRCNACGAKALLAASQCPKCSQWLGLRDERGEMLPLARCGSCHCYHPRGQGACRWCEAAQPGPRAASFAWGGLGVVLMAAVAWGAVRVFGGSGAPAPPRMTAMAMTVAQQPVPPPSDSARPVQQGSAPARSAAIANPATAAEKQAGPQRRSEPEPSTIQFISAATNAAATPAVPIVSTAADTVRPMPGDEGTARNWVNVRAGTGRDSEILGVIKPDTRVRFGRARGAWIEVKTPQLSGWADSRLFSVAR